MAVEAAGAEPLSAILARLDAFENRLTKLETRQRRPPPFPITVVENDRFQLRSVRSTSCRPDSPPNATSALAVIGICITRSRAGTARWPRSISASTDAPTNFAGCASGWRPSRPNNKERRHEGCLQPMNEEGADGRFARAAGQGQTRPRVRTTRDGKPQRGTPDARDLAAPFRSRARVAET